MPATRHTTIRTNNITKASGTIADATESATNKKVTSKRAREPEELVHESEPAPAKKAKTLTNKLNTESHVRRSARSPRPTHKVVAEKKKRQNAAEVKAAKAATKEAKKRKVEAEQEAHCRLAEMDIDDDRERAQVATRAIRRLSDVASEEEGEEFIGFDEASSSSSDDAEDVHDFQVSLVSIAIKSVGTHRH